MKINLPAEGQSVLNTEVDERRESTFVLLQLDVFNWGPFAGLHRAQFDPRGTAIIGPTGSGKTTLVDAMMTLLVSQPRYNLASTGGHESDRTLISYVRGVLGGDGSDGREEVARPGKTITGICATYQNNKETVRLSGLLWTEGASNATADLKRRWLFSLAEDQTFEQWLQTLHEDGVRELMRLGRETAKLRIFDSKKAYLAHARKFFDVGENAFTLLNRAAGLKQLNSIDEIFRDLVLDDRTAFDRALEVAGEFDNLAGIHAELETARRQQEALLPVAAEHQKLLKSRGKSKSLRQLKRILPIWFALEGQRRWRHSLNQIASDKAEAVAKLQCEQTDEQVCRSRVNTLREQYLEVGGNVIGELERTITVESERVVERKRYAGDYRRMIGKFELSDELSEASLLRNQATLRAKRLEIQKQHDETQEEMLSALSQQREVQSNMADVQAALEKVKARPGSNIPPKFQDFRATLAEQLGLNDRDLPFLAELVEVKPEEAPWRGAIERAIGSERLRVLVPERKLDAALRWVNKRDNRLHVRLQRAHVKEHAAQFFDDSFASKINFREHPLQQTARRLLSNCDRHCVESAESLRNIEHGVTIEGLMSGRKGKFEKQDQRRLAENWMTGFDNKDQLESLAKSLEDNRRAEQHWSNVVREFRDQLLAFGSRLTVLDQIVSIEFSTIDLPTAEADLRRSQERLAALLDPNSDAAQAKHRYDAEHEELESIRERIVDSNRLIAVLESRHAQAESGFAKAVERTGEGLSDEQLCLAKKRISISPGDEPDDLSDEERRVAGVLEAKLSQQLDRVGEHEKRLVRLMEGALRVDTGALAESGSDLEDIPDYLERLRVLIEEALPEKLSRFLDYLNRSSDQGVTQLLSGITEEVGAIEHRIQDLNHTLAKVDFRSERYLQLQPQRVSHERLRTLEVAIRKLRSAALKDDQGESHYKALRELVEILRDAGQNRRQLGSRALLDPRYRLQFFVVEVNRKTGDRSPPRTGSQSGSGGEKELMASHILTASLSYALCPAEATRPLYGTVVLDEAFSKSSPSAASRIIEALRIFCLHPIFVTPNKEIGLLKRHTQKVICVQRPGKQAGLATISWEKLEDFARPQ